MPGIKKVQEPFPVLRLPPEVRNCIWRYAVVKEGDVIIQNHGRQRLASDLPASRLRSGCELHLHREDDQRKVASKLAVAFTCRQMYLEVTPIYYQENTFYFKTLLEFYLQKVRGFAEAIGSEKAASILSVCLTAGPGPQIKYLSCFPGLKRLEFLSDPPPLGSPGWILEVISYVQKHPSVVVTHNGEVWGLQRWIISLAETSSLGSPS